MSKFSAEEDLKLIELYGTGANQVEIAASINRPRTSVKDRGAWLGLDWQEANPTKRFQQAMQATQTVYLGRLAEVAPEPDIRPIELKIEASKTKRLIEGPEWIDLVYGDIHFPFQDDRAVDALYHLTELIKPDRIVSLGDVVDNWQISDFLPPDERKLTTPQKSMAAQFELAAKHFGTMRSLAPNAEYIFLEGNHEERLTRFLRRAQTDYRLRHVFGLPSVQEALDLRHLMGTDSAKVEYRAYNRNEFFLNEHILVTHGDISNKYATRSMLERYGKSVIFGHSHRVQNWVKRDLKATEAAWNIGCLCDLNPHYGDNSTIDWAQGLAVVVHGADDHFNVVQLRIHWGQMATPWGLIGV